MIKTPTVRRPWLSPLPPTPHAETSYRFELVPAMQNVLFDLESYAIANVADFIEKPTAPANYKNPETIERYEADALLKAIARAALKPHLGRIVCLSWQQDDRDSEPRVLLCRDEDEEAKTLELFWDDLAGEHATDRFKRLIGFNSHRFDMPFLMTRSLVLDVEFPRLRVDRHSPHLDLARLLTFDDTIEGYSLQFYLKRYEKEMRARGIDVDIDDDCTGADIAELYQAGHWDAVKNHCVCDVKRLYALASFMHAIDERVEAEQPF